MTTIRTRLAVLATAGALATVGAATAATAAAGAQSVPRCGNDSLAVTTTFVDAGAGHSWMSLIYRNASTRTCTVSGYPGLDAVSRTNHVLAHATRTLRGYGGAGQLRTVTVRPGGYASASVEWLNFDGPTGGRCAFSAAVDTIVPNTTRAHRLPVSVSACGLQVHPTVAGTGQYRNYGPAQRDWIAGDRAVSAETGRYFLAAEAQLRAARIYPTQVRTLAQLASLPETGLTATQFKQARADVAALDDFFATPGLYA